MDFLGLIAIFAVWFVLQMWVLPKFRVGT